MIRSILLLTLLISFSTANSAFALPITSHAQQHELNLKAKIPAVLNGIAALPGCSGSLIRFTQDANAKAVVLSNGHCIDLIAPGTFRANEDFRHAVNLFDRNNNPVRVPTQRLIYATMTGTDISMIELDATYAQLEAKGIDAFAVSKTAAPAGTPIIMTSGYFRTSEQCKVDAIVFELHEDKWKFTRSYRYGDCDAIHGTSGSPLIAANERVVVGINNTGNDDGERCTLNNPCEVDEHGNVTVTRGMNYGQQTFPILSCVNAQGTFDLKNAGCSLPGSARWRAVQIRH